MVDYIEVQKLTDTAFAPFGEKIVPPSKPGRATFDRALESLRTDALPILSIVRTGDPGNLPLTIRQMERHPKSSQSFVPLEDMALLVLVAPHSDAGGPDMSSARAFVATDGVGVTYGADVWHHPLTVLSGTGALAIFMWCDGGPDDEEFVDIEPTIIAAIPQ